MPSSRRQIILALGLSLLAVAASNVYIASRTGFLHGPNEPFFPNMLDHHLYLEMAKGPDNYARSTMAHLQPFSYRLLTPWLAYLLTLTGLSLNASFFLLSQGCLVAFLTLLYLLLRRMGMSPALSRTGILLAGLLPGAVRWYAYKYWMTDPLALLLTVSAFLAIAAGKDMALMQVSVLGILNRENYLMVFPYCFLHLLKRKGFRTAAVRTAAVSAVPLLLFFIVRYYVTAVGRPPLADIVSFYARLRLSSLYLQPYLSTIGSLGVIIPLLLLFPGGLIRYWAGNYDRLAVVVMVYGALLLANDTDRLIVYALPAVLPPALGNLRAFIRLSRLPRSACLAAVLALQIFFYARIGYDQGDTPPIDWVLIAVTAVFWIGCQVLVRRRGRSQGGQARRPHEVLVDGPGGAASLGHGPDD